MKVDGLFIASYSKSRPALSTPWRVYLFKSGSAIKQTSVAL